MYSTVEIFLHSQRGWFFELFSELFERQEHVSMSLFHFYKKNIVHLFFINNPFLTLALKIASAFLQNCPKKLLVDGLLTSIVSILKQFPFQFQFPF